MPENHRFHLAIGSRFENIELVQVVLNDSLERLGVDGEARHWVDIAVREAVANAIKHGNRQDPGKKVRIDASVEGSTASVEGSTACVEDPAASVEEPMLVIRIEDEGVGFDPSQLDDPLAPENLLKPNGRGIFYMRSFMDDIQYGPRPGGGTVVTLKKRLKGLGAPGNEIPAGGIQ